MDEASLSVVPGWAAAVFQYHGQQQSCSPPHHSAFCSVVDLGLV